MLFGSESEDPTHSASPSGSVRSAIGSTLTTSRETAPQEGEASAPAAPPISAAASSAAPPDGVASCWRTVAARWILPMAAAILLVAPSLVVGWHALRTRANVDNMEKLTPPVVSATYAANGVTPPPAGEELSAVMDRSEESDQESAVRRDLKSQGLDFQSCTIAVSGDRATAQCSGTLQFVPRIGAPLPRGAEQQWVFTMRRVGGTWTIAQAVASQAPVVATGQARNQG